MLYAVVSSSRTCTCSVSSSTRHFGLKAGRAFPIAFRSPRVVTMGASGSSSSSAAVSSGGARSARYSGRTLQNAMFRRGSAREGGRGVGGRGEMSQPEHGGRAGARPSGYIFRPALHDGLVSYSLSPLISQLPFSCLPTPRSSWIGSGDPCGAYSSATHWRCPFIVSRVDDARMLLILRGCDVGGHCDLGDRMIFAMKVPIVKDMDPTFKTLTNVYAEHKKRFG